MAIYPNRVPGCRNELFISSVQVTVTSPTETEARGEGRNLIRGTSAAQPGLKPQTIDLQVVSPMFYHWAVQAVHKTDEDIAITLNSAHNTNAVVVHAFKKTG